MTTRANKIYLTATIPEDFAGLRVDQAIARLFPEHSRMRLQNWLREKKITVAGKFMLPREKVKGGEEVIVDALLEATENWSAQPIDLNIIFEDEHLLVINKPAGLVVHPATGNREGTMLNALLHKEPNLQHLPRAGIVHRLDKDTSGILVVAKTLIAHTHLVRQLQMRTIEREYRAIVCGVMIAGGTVDAPIGRHPRFRTKMAVVGDGKPAVTHYRVLERFRAHTYIKVSLETGRTHQIRVHMSHIHYPLIGDTTYNVRAYSPAGASPELLQILRQFNRQALHAYRLQLQHPVSDETLSWIAPVPEDMNNLLQVLQHDLENKP